MFGELNDMLLSILIPGKNDDYRVNTKKVLQFNIQQTLFNIEKLGCNDVEVVLCDWGSQEKILDILPIHKPNYFKCVYVSPEIAQKYNNGYSYSIVHPINVSFRYSSGKYVVFWDSDCFVPYETFELLYKFVKKMDENNDLTFYWGSRFDVPFDSYFPFNNIEEFNLFLNTTEQTFYNDRIRTNESFGGCSISLLMNRILWEESTGWWEKLTQWGWQDIEFHRRLLAKYECGGDLQDHGMNFYHMLSPRGFHTLSTLGESPKIFSPVFEANDSSWGLKNEILEVI